MAQPGTANSLLYFFVLASGRMPLADSLAHDRVESIFARIGFDMEHYVATFIYSAAAFGFSIHNFHFSQRFHFVNGIVSSLITGVFLIFLCSSLASRAAFKNMDATSLFWVSGIAFLVCWTVAVYAVFVHRRRSLHAPNQSSSNTDSGLKHSLVVLTCDILRAARTEGRVVE